MTDERKKFLASISKEEQIIRQAISLWKHILKRQKLFLNVFGYALEKNFLKDRMQEICATKATIKALKKQLPAPRIPLELNEVVFPCTCSVCKYPFAEDNYCPCCGQKLR